MQIKLNRFKTIDYPSGSALEFYDNTLFLIGDDSNKVICLDNNWSIINTIQLFEFDGKRIPKPDKADLECATIIGQTLYIVGSGSKSPQRDVAFLVDLLTTNIEKTNLTAFYSNIRNNESINELNFEGFTVCKDKLLWFNRANSKQDNQLIVSSQSILQQQTESFEIIPINIGNINDIPLGISGASYCEKNDILFITASVEDTENAYDDGKILGSAIAIIQNFSEKLKHKNLEIDELILLDKVDNVFIQQKIEAICIVEQTDNIYKCSLVADNDTGNSVLFEIEIEI